MRARQVLAAGVAIFCLVSVVLGTVCSIAVDQPLNAVMVYPAFAAFAVAGWVITAKRPENLVGFIVLMAGLGFAMLPWLTICAWAISHHVAGADVVASIAGAAFVLDVGGLALLLPLLFPDGRLPSPSRWWRVVLLSDLAYMVLASFNVLQPTPIPLTDHTQVPNAFAVPSLHGVVNVAIASCVPFLFIGFIGSLTALVRRWRTADADRRAQMKWVLITLMLAPAPFIAHDAAPSVSNLLFTLVLPLVPTSIAVSILRYRLYDIDRIVSRTVSYLLVTGLLLGVYVGCVALTTGLLHVSSSLGVAASTLAAAGAFQPLRRRVQALVDRRFNRARYDAARTIDSFSARLRDEVDVATVTTDLLDVVGRTVQPRHASMWVAP